MTNVNNSELLNEIKKLTNEKKSPFASSVEKIILSVLSFAITALFAFILDINVRVSLLEQSITNDVLSKTNTILLQKVDDLEKEIVNLKFKIKDLEVQNRK